MTINIDSWVRMLKSMTIHKFNRKQIKNIAHEYGVNAKWYQFTSTIRKNTLDAIRNHRLGVK